MLLDPIEEYKEKEGAQKIIDGFMSLLSTTEFGERHFELKSFTNKGMIKLAYPILKRYFGILVYAEILCQSIVLKILEEKLKLCFVDVPGRALKKDLSFHLLRYLIVRSDKFKDINSRQLV